MGWAGVMATCMCVLLVTVSIDLHHLTLPSSLYRFPDSQPQGGGAGGRAAPPGGDQLGDDGNDDLYS